MMDKEVHFKEERSLKGQAERWKQPSELDIK